MADGKSPQCRFCGAGEFSDISCPPSSCHFANEPTVPYFWDKTCKVGVLGCWADGIHAQCRFCGVGPYIDVKCPLEVGSPHRNECEFYDKPFVPHYWDHNCTHGMLGCLADGIHVGCRFCGMGSYKDIICPIDALKECTFINEPKVPYFWDQSCEFGKLGCMADGIHKECRFCRQRPFESIECPEPVRPPVGRCYFPGGEPFIPYYWDEGCQMGKLGCWADGLHAECRFCGVGDYQNVTCPVVRDNRRTAESPSQLDQHRFQGHSDYKPTDVVSGSPMLRLVFPYGFISAVALRNMFS